jgi:8-oxo-dGTP pyrophosphatase MutT (NUDIX family)
MIDRYRSTVICLHANKILGFHAEDPTSGTAYFFLPGGKIEAGETPRESALREAIEETGYDVILTEGFEEERVYPFLWNGQMYLSRTVFFAGTLRNSSKNPQKIIDDDTYHRGVAWIDLKDVQKSLAYQPEILAATEQAILFLKNKI